jgi:signal transduction histidine kinase
MDGADAVTNEPQDRHKQHPPPSYDTDKQDYAGISAGALDSLGELHDARNFAEMIVDTVREGLLVLDFDLHVVAANESFYEAFAVRPEATVGRKVYNLGNGQWAIPELRELLEGILPQQRALNDYEVEHDFKGVGRRALLLNARRLDDHQLILLAIEDVTERRTGERELKTLNETLEARVRDRTQKINELALTLTLAEQRERQQLAQVLHDDLQQVLFGLQLNVAVLERQVPSLSPEAIQRELKHAQDIIGESIAATRRLTMDLSPPGKAGEGLRASIGWLANHVRERFRLEVEVHADQDLPEPRHEMRLLICQLVRELLFNVVKHAGTGKAGVTADEEDGYVRVVVEDDGAGFDLATLEKASGLGLPSVRDRLELVGGRLEVASAVGRGTRVTITVPIQPV